MKQRKHQPVRPWKLLSSSVALDEKWFHVRKDIVQLPSSKIIDDFFLWEGPRIATIVPVTPEGRFVLVKQYRHAVSKVLAQFPAGSVDPGESLEQAARREMREETGYETDRELIHLASLAPYATKLTGTEDVFLALSAQQHNSPVYDEQEESEIIILDREALIALIDKPTLQMAGSLTAAAFLAMRYLDLHSSS